VISQAQQGDEILLIGWDFSLEMILTQKFGQFPQLQTFLESAHGNGASVRMLATPPNSSNGDTAAQVAEATARKLEAFIDDQLPAGSSHHQKSVLVKLKERTHLFVGGMDVALGRRKWFDVHAEIIGLGASLGRKTLEERWESVRPPLGGLSFTQKSLPSPDGDAHRVQFVRTYPPFPQDTTGWKRAYAKDGEHTYYSLMSRAIASATKSIYIEEQFFVAMGPAPKRLNPAGGSSPRQRSDVPDVPDTFERLLQDAIGRGVKVVVVAANKVRPIAHHDPSGRDALVRSLADPKNPPVLLQPRPDSWFVHSKTWIFDDEFVLIGSGNFWPQSFVSVQQPSESEFGVAFTSKADGASLGFPKASYARALRIKLWERLKHNRDPGYTFPRDVSMSFDDEVKELRKPIGGVDCFEEMK